MRDSFSAFLAGLGEFFQGHKRSRGGGRPDVYPLLMAGAEPTLRSEWRGVVFPHPRAAPLLEAVPLEVESSNVQGD